jgi:hypothetical protein
MEIKFLMVSVMNSSCDSFNNDEFQENYELFSVMVTETHPERIAVSTAQVPYDQEMNEVLLGNPATARGKGESSKEAPRSQVLLESRSDEQGGRWLDTDQVDSESPAGYGVHHHHISQRSHPEVQAATRAMHREDREESRQAANAARASEQGGRWLAPEDIPVDAPTQGDQPDVQHAVAASHDPKFVQKEEKKNAARHHATGGRW